MMDHMIANDVVFRQKDDLQKPCFHYQSTTQLLRKDLLVMKLFT